MTKCFSTENVEIFVILTSNGPVTQEGSMKSVLEYLFVLVSHYLINLTQIFHNKVITNFSAFRNIKDKRSMTQPFFHDNNNDNDLINSITSFQTKSYHKVPLVPSPYI